MMELMDKNIFSLNSWERDIKRLYFHSYWVESEFGKPQISAFCKAVIESLVLINNPANPSQISAELWGSKSDSLPLKASQRDSV